MIHEATESRDTVVFNVRNLQGAGNPGPALNPVVSLNPQAIESGGSVIECMVSQTGKRSIQGPNLQIPLSSYL